MLFLPLLLLPVSASSVVITAATSTTTHLLPALQVLALNLNYKRINWWGLKRKKYNTQKEEDKEAEEKNKQHMENGDLEEEKQV